VNTEGQLLPVSNRLFRVSSIAPNPNGTVAVTYDDLQRQTIEKSPTDPQMQRVLLYALQNPPNSGVRLDAMDALRARVADQQVRQTMLWVLVHDPNPGVRLKAVDSLRAAVSDDPSVRQTLVRTVLTDDNPGVRSEAIDALTQAPPQDASQLLEDVARRSSSPYVKLRCANALKQLQAPISRDILPAGQPDDAR
jgi:HEAT repeat protein